WSLPSRAQKQTRSAGEDLMQSSVALWAGVGTPDGLNAPLALTSRNGVRSYFTSKVNPCSTGSLPIWKYNVYEPHPSPVVFRLNLYLPVDGSKRKTPPGLELPASLAA